MTEPVELKAGEITQADRDAAAPFIMSDLSDEANETLVQAFARHRLSHSAPPRESTREMVEQIAVEIEDGMRAFLRSAGFPSDVRAPSVDDTARRIASLCLAAPQANSLAVGELVERLTGAHDLLGILLAYQGRPFAPEDRECIKKVHGDIAWALDALSRPAPSSPSGAAYDLAAAYVDALDCRILNREGLLDGYSGQQMVECWLAGYAAAPSSDREATIEALRGLIEGVEQHCNEPAGGGISGYLSARLTDARNVLVASPGAMAGERESIRLNAAEVQSRCDRVRWAEGLIAQLPANHDGRNSWLLNYGQSPEAAGNRAARKIEWDAATKSAALTPKEPTP